ncbi:MAG: sugar transporter [Acidobacteria bacterium]|nr:MAG: sugar transporter [Acidobacteriota bacterium]
MMSTSKRQDAARRKTVWSRRAAAAAGLILAVGVEATVAAQATAPQERRTPAAAAVAAVPARPSAVAADYVIGADDVLSILFWRDKDLSAPDVTVRPDGKVTLPLLNDMQAAGLTPDQLRDAIQVAAQKYVEDPNPTVIVKEIKSRKVFITGQVEKAGPYPLNGSTTVLQLIATAGGLREFADGKDISVMRTENGKPSVYAFNYQDVLKKRNLRQNIELKPGDVVVVP